MCVSFLFNFLLVTDCSMNHRYLKVANTCAKHKGRIFAFRNAPVTIGKDGSQTEQHKSLTALRGLSRPQAMPAGAVASARRPYLSPVCRH
jgi:hypothetical protein